MAAGDVTQHPAGTCLPIEPVPSPQPSDSKGNEHTNAADHTAAGQGTLGSSGSPQRSPATTATEAAARGLWLPAPEVLGSLTWPWLVTHESAWSPERVSPTLNLRLDGRIVPSAAAGGARVSFSHLIVLDGFFREPERREIAAFLSDGGSGGERVASTAAAEGVAAERCSAQFMTCLRSCERRRYHLLLSSSQPTAQSRARPYTIILRLA